jgi:hypothetical protein
MTTSKYLMWDNIGNIIKLLERLKESVNIKCLPWYLMHMKYLVMFTYHNYNSDYYFYYLDFAVIPILGRQQSALVKSRLLDQTAS